MLELATAADVDIVVVGTGGVVSLRPVLAALDAGKIVATANKETLVAGGHLVMPLARARAAERARGRSRGPAGAARSAGSGRSTRSTPRSGSAWSARTWRSVERLILTASGGPFLDTAAAEFAAITPEQALRHPTWRMGAKITIDSATLANKGLEVIEARWLYDVAYEQIDVVIHPQSVVHSAVQFVDGSLKAQLGTPDMRLPIQYALTLPRPPAVAGRRARPRRRRRASTSVPRTRRASRRCASRARRAGSGRGPPRRSSRPTTSRSPASSTARLDFPGIPRLLEAAVARFGTAGGADPDVDELLALDAEVRAHRRLACRSGARA